MRPVSKTQRLGEWGGSVVGSGRAAGPRTAAREESAKDDETSVKH